MLRDVTRAGLTGLIALLGFAGCSLGADEERGSTEPARGAPKEVAATVKALERAVRARDWRAICDDLFTPSARRRAGGRDCPRLVRSSAGELRSPRIQLLAIELRRGRAEARVRTRARGQAPLTDTITLRRARGGYLIEALR
jgi:hypothetical protein